MEVHSNLNYSQAFIATSQDIEKIWKALEKQRMSVKASVACSDSIVRHFEDYKLLIDYENPQRASISSIEISGRNRDSYTIADVLLGNKYTENISLSIRGEEELVKSLHSSISDIIAGMKPWYSHIAKADLWYIFFPIFIITILFMQIITPLDTHQQAITFIEAISILVIISAVSGVIITLIGLVAWLKKRFFPISTFAIGQGIARHKYNEQVRWGVIISFFVGLIASIISTLLLSI